MTTLKGLDRVSNAPYEILILIFSAEKKGEGERDLTFSATREGGKKDISRVS